MEFISNRDIVVRSSKTGHAIKFEKNIPQGAPKSMYDELVAIGILPVEESDVKIVQKQIEEKEKPVVLAPEDGAERAEKILEVIEAMFKRNDPADFTGGGEPAAKAIQAVLGWRVDQTEVRGIWKKNRERIHKENGSGPTT